MRLLARTSLSYSTERSALLNHLTGTAAPCSRIRPICKSSHNRWHPRYITVFPSIILIQHILYTSSMLTRPFILLPTRAFPLGYLYIRLSSSITSRLLRSFVRNLTYSNRRTTISDQGSSSFGVSHPLIIRSWLTAMKNRRAQRWNKRRNELG